MFKTIQWIQSGLKTVRPISQSSQRDQIRQINSCRFCLGFLLPVEIMTTAMTKLRGQMAWAVVAWVVPGALIWNLGGCQLLQKQAPQSVQLYTFDAGAPKSPVEVKAASSVATSSVEVKMPVVLPPYASRLIVYRVGSNQLLQDPYRAYAASPADMLQAQAIAWLRLSGLFDAGVVNSYSKYESDFLLETNVITMCLDQSGDQVVAELQVRMILLAKKDHQHMPIQMDEVYMARVAVESQDDLTTDLTNDLTDGMALNMQAMGHAWAEVLEAFQADAAAYLKATEEDEKQDEKQG